MNIAKEAIFFDRRHAAEHLTTFLSQHVDSESVIVSTSRGSAKLGSYLSQELDLPHELVLCTDLKHPGGHNKTIGSICSKEICTHDIPRDLPQEYIAYKIQILEHLQTRLNAEAYGNLPQPEFKQKTIILIADWVSNGDKLISSIHFIKKQRPRKIIVAIPAISLSAATAIRGEVDDLLFLHLVEENACPQDIYESLPEITTKEVKKCIRISRRKNACNTTTVSDTASIPMLFYPRCRL